MLIVPIPTLETDLQIYFVGIICNLDVLHVAKRLDLTTNEQITIYIAGNADSPVDLEWSALP